MKFSANVGLEFEADTCADALDKLRAFLQGAQYADIETTNAAVYKQSELVPVPSAP